ncbi:MAG: CRISPR-associated protein Csa3 [Archaeoglobi archaeon]|nr:CRISPR-associated protein Csa3 [Archaeoglobi archaeon]
MMKVLVATVGGSEDPIIISARKLGFDKAVLIAGRPADEIFDRAIEGKPNPLVTAENIKRRLGELGGEVEIELVNPFDFEECCFKIMNVIERERSKGDVFVVISGGTKIQSIAASYAAFISGCRVLHVQEMKDGSEIVELPLSFAEVDGISKARREVLRVLEDGDDSVSISRKLGISRKTASQYLKELKEYGLVEVIEGRVKRYRPTFAGKLCRLRWWV